MKGRFAVRLDSVNTSPARMGRAATRDFRTTDKLGSRLELAA